MQLLSLSLQQFRKLSAAQYRLDDKISIITGQNGSGKTSILEAIHVLATGKSFRAGKIEEMVSFDAELARVAGEFFSADETTKLEILLTRGIVQGKTTRSALYSVNEVRKRQRDFVGKLLCVTFRPEDMRLIEGSTSRRRGYLDTPLSLLSQQYAYSLKTYQQSLVRRNKLLQKVRDGEMPATVLTFWSQQLLKHGAIIQDQRRAFIEFAQTVSFSLPLKIEYDHSLMTEARLQQYARAELAAGHTLVGPHKDDIVVTMPFGKSAEPRSIASYGSRGQQRLAVLWLKLVELAYVRQQSQEQPILLLDDILSELDEANRLLVHELMANNQTIITSADETVVADLAGTRIELEL